MKAAAFHLMPLLAAAVLAAGCSSLNPFSSSAAKPASLQDFTPSAQLAVSWRASVGAAGDYRFQPAVWDGNVYAAGHRGEVARFDAGRQVWRADLDTRLSAGVGTDGRLAVVVATDGTVVALDAQNGAERWRAAVGAEVLAPPAVSLEFVIVRASDNRLIALDARDGSQRWVYQRNNPPLALRSFASVLIEGPVVLAGFPGGKLAVLNITNGGAITELNVALPRGATELERVADVVGTPVIGRREVCAVAYQGRAACFDTSNGNAIWAREFSSSVGMDRDARFAMITDDGDAVHALDVYSGASVWKQDALARRSVSRPLIVGEHVVVGDFDGYVHLLNRETGAFAARDRAGSDAVAADPVVLGRGFVVQDMDGDITAYEVR
ncbi:MAG: outer membrane protein assembly factor BamB [Thauera sp.]